MSEFKREDRYIVLKLKRLPKDEAEYLRDCHPKAMVECVVVEHDWPEYHLVWAMIEHRIAGKPVPDFNLWRRADALQALLNAADEREDTAIAFVTRLIECAGGQPSVATGYLRDILDVLKPAEPASDEHVCSGCGSKGWTANCKECVPY